MQEYMTSLDVIGFCDDGSDETLASKEFAKKRRNPRCRKTPGDRDRPIRSRPEEEGRDGCLPVLSPMESTKNFSSSVLWPTRAQKMKFLVAEDNGAMSSSAKSLIQDNIKIIDGTDCNLDAVPRSKMSKPRRPMTDSLNIQREDFPEPPHSRPKVHYDDVRTQEDPFPDPSLLDPIDLDQQDGILTAVDVFVQFVKNRGMENLYLTKLNFILGDLMDISRTDFSAGSPAKLLPLKIERTPDAKTMKIRLLKYSQEQKDFMPQFLKELVNHGMAYQNPTSKLAFAPLFVRNKSAFFRFKVDISPVNAFTVNDHYPMHKLEHKITCLVNTAYLADLEMAHSYWKLLLAPGSQECQSFITPNSIFTLTRVLHGTTNAVTHLQSSMAGFIPENPRPKVPY